MKRIKFYLVLFFATCFASHQTYAQSNDSLGVTFISPNYPQCPDSAFMGQSVDSINVTIQNFDTTTFVGQLYVVFDASDTLNQIFLANDSLLLNGGIVVTIQGLSTATFVVPGSITFDTAHYRIGSNVVVVWPATNNGLLKHSTYSACVITFSTLGINDFNDLSSLFVVEPNPTHSKIMLKTEIHKITESVRIYDATGRMVYHEKMKSNTIPVEFLNPGIYVLEIATKNNQRFRKQFLKE